MFGLLGLIVKTLLFAAIFIEFSIAVSNSTKYHIRAKEKQILDHILHPSVYDNRIRPAYWNETDDKNVNGPVIVRVNIFLRSVSNIDDTNMEYNVQITFREMWNDDRLQYANFDGSGTIRYLTLVDSSRIWMPDLFFTNEKLGHYHNILSPNKYLRIYSNGNILYSTRISLRLSCPMDLKLMPFDKQICSIRMASYGWTTEDIVFLWKENDPVNIVKNLHLKRFNLQKFRTDYCNSRTSTGEYSCIKVDFLFERTFSYYYAQIYIPCVMLVILSWLTFWIDEKAITARLFLGVCVLLSMTLHISKFNHRLPETDYTKGIDVWTGINLTFVFAAVIEYIAIHILCCQSQISSTELSKSKENIDNGSTTTKTVESRTPTSNSGDIERIQSDPSDSSIQRSKVKILYKNFISKMPKSITKKIDILARILFPVIYILFLIVYWISYKNSANFDL